MLKKMLQNKFKIIIGFVLILLLIFIRAFENQLFYDPFLSYFKSEYTNVAFPKINTIKLFLSLGFRYYLNSIDRKSTRLNSSHRNTSRMPSSA